MNQRAIEKTELNKILSSVAEYAVLDVSKEALKICPPITDIALLKNSLDKTEECVKLLFTHGVGKVEYVPPLSDEIVRAERGSTLSCGELLSMASLLRSTRIAYGNIHSITDDEIKLMRQVADCLYFDQTLEEDISTRILSDTEIADHASDRLYTIRREIRLLNERIRARLAEYLTGTDAKYLQDGIVTMRDNRYVLPVRAEYKRSIKGFIHDRSASGATFFIEPEEVLEMNNELRSLGIDEKEEMERILAELSHRVGNLASELYQDIEVLQEIDEYCARAEYAYKLSCVKPNVNEKGVISIQP